MTIGDGTGGQKQRGEGQDVAADHPFDVGEVSLQIPRDGR